MDDGKEKRPKTVIADPDTVAYADETQTVFTDGRVVQHEEKGNMETFTNEELAAVGTIIGPLLHSLRPLEDELRSIFPKQATNKEQISRTFSVPITEAQSKILLSGRNSMVAQVGIVFWLGMIPGDSLPDELLEIGDICERYGYHVAPRLSIGSTSLTLQLDFKPKAVRN
ncbi:hypothetical protein K2P56_00355 [Patescibacteria group bacterium]|nr:hypothetical protein [Patescibacteria group bacterium]